MPSTGMACHKLLAGQDGVHLITQIAAYHMTRVVPGVWRISSYHTYIRVYTRIYACDPEKQGYVSRMRRVCKYAFLRLAYALRAYAYAFFAYEYVFFSQIHAFLANICANYQRGL
jgi:hypothetical protein